MGISKTSLARVVKRLALWFVLILPGAGQAETHIFSLPDGRALEAEIVGYDFRTGRIEIERIDGKRVKVDPAGFIQPDQQYIKDWIAANAFLSDGVLKVKCDRRLLKRWKERESVDIRYSSGEIEEGFIHNVIKYEEVAYGFVFRNQGVAPIRGLMLEYCIYYEQSAMSWQTTPKEELKTVYGSIDLPTIPSKEEISLQTDPVKIYEDNLNRIPMREEDARRGGKGKVIGIRARLSLKDGDKKTMRELLEPDTMAEEDYPWTNETSTKDRPPSYLYGPESRTSD